MDFSDNLPIFCMAISMREGISYNYPSANELTLKDIGKTKTKHNKIPIAWMAHIFYGLYSMFY